MKHLAACVVVEAFNEIYRNAPGAKQVSEMLLRTDVPRSLQACIGGELDQALASLPGNNGRAAQRLAAELNVRLR